MAIQDISIAEAWANDPKLRKIVRDKARKASTLPGYSVSDVDDFQQELWLHLLTRLSCYDSSRSSPGTFASRLLDNHIRTLVRSARAEKRSGGRAPTSIDQDDCDTPSAPAVSQLVDVSTARRHLGVSHVPEVKLADQRLDVQEIISGTSPATRKLAAVLSHVPQFAAGEVIGLSRRRTAAIVAKLRELFEAAGLAPDVQISAPPRM
jgi:RNA polymerase sigma factor (sigma-70 family)